MNFWISTAFTDTRQLVEIARKADALGFTGIAVSDHVFTPQDLRSPYPYAPDGKIFWPPENHWPDNWVLIGAMAAVTTRLRFTNNVYILPLRNLFVTAKAVATAAVISDNRVALGAGAGWMKEEFDQLGQDFHTRGRHMDEVIAVLRKLWAGGMVEHHGRFYDFPPLQLSPVPSQPVPIWVGGESEAALRRAAYLGDGWVSNRHNLAEVEYFVGRIEALRREAGREREPFDYLIPFSDPLTPDNLRRLEDLGVHHLLTRGWGRYGGDMTTLAAKLESMERFAAEIL